MKRLTYRAILVCCFAITSHTFPVNDDEEAKLYLQQFGYLPVSNGLRAGAVLARDAVSKALKNFQRFAGIDQTGELDNDTIVMMRKPRCGVKDILQNSESSRKKRYNPEGSRWRYRHLTYMISKYPTRLIDRKKVDREIARAFKVWSDVAPLSFQEKKRLPVNINIRFESGPHNDGFDFDGPGQTLAHAFFPQYGGDAHFDNEEQWTIDERTSGTNVFKVAVHEFGHSLGLLHTEKKNTVMYAFYNETSLTLDPDDIEGIQYLYGFRSQSLPSKDDEEPAPDLCQDPTIDTISRTEDGSTYVFKGNFYWKILSDGIANGYPRNIAEDWDGLEGNLDASLTWPNGKTYFFKGENYWRFMNKEKDSGFPKFIDEGFAGIPNDIDAAVRLENGKTYFFQGNQYWLYDSNGDPPVNSDQYPKPMNDWKGLPTEGIDAAFQWDNGRTYFFKGSEYYKFNDDTFEVDSRTLSYPQPTKKWWFNCTRSNN